MSQVQVFEEQPGFQDRAIGRLAEWAEAADAAYLVAQRLVQSSFVPAAFKGKSHEAAAAILSGLEVGLQPMASLRAFDVIGGQAAARAMTLRAIVQSYGHHIELVESGVTRCRMRGRRRGSQEWQTVTWTMERAKQLNLAMKDNWRRQPQAMLLARATSELCRLIAADAILGIPYSSEEIADGVAEPATVPASEQVEGSGLRTMSRAGRKTLSSVSEPATPVAEVEEVEVVEVAPISAKQLTALNAALTGMGLSKREDKLSWISSNLDRAVTTSKDLTRQEAHRLIDLITGPPAEDPA